MRNGWILVLHAEKEVLLVIMPLFLVVLLMIRCFVLLTCFFVEILQRKKLCVESSSKFLIINYVFVLRNY